MGRAPAQTKATYGGILQSVYANDVPLRVYGSDPQQKAAMYLKAYKVGWFYKAGKKIAGDVAGLERTLSYEDTEGDNEDEIVAPALTVPWEQLDPIEQYLRLMEKPNPYQTGRTLFTKTEIRLDFAGMAFWYLEGGEGGQLPTGLYGISPARMWPSLDAQSRLIGWVMDKDDRGGGIPFSVDEILPFIVPDAGDDYWAGQGVVEAVYANVPLSEQMARHTSNVLQTGGRLAGMIWPKDRALSEDEYADAQRAWRNVSSDPNAAKRMLVFPEPMEYAAGASSPAEIGIPELATLSRDEILTAFPISPYQLGVPMPGGLNSAETRKEDRHDYWEGTIHPRVELLEETIQWGLVTRYENAIGRPLDFDIEEPNLDDAPALIEKVGAYKGLVSIGFDPKESVDAVGLAHIKWNGLPAILDPAQQLQMQQDAAAARAEAVTSGVSVTAGDSAARDAASTSVSVSKAVKARREDVMGRELPGFQGTMQTFLHDQRARIEADVIETLGPLTKAARKDAPEWWHQKREDDLLGEALHGIYIRLTRSALGVVANDLSRVVYAERIRKVAQKMLDDAGDRITGINETTRKAVAEQIAEGTRRGYSPLQIANGVGQEGYTGIRNDTAFDEARAELVARTETMLGYNQSALLGYKEFNVAEVEAIDGDQDEECAERNGQVFSVDEALTIEDHPNGTLDWIPLTDSKAVDVDNVGRVIDFATKALELANRPQDLHVTVSQPDVHVDGPQITVEAAQVNVPEPVVTVAAAEAPIVNVTVPEQAAPVVNVTLPETKAGDITVNVPKPDIKVKATMSGNMKITGMPDRVTSRQVKRNDKGQITESVDVETDG